jgi:alpha-ketoglutarate-dependent taurine dioxygenase
MNGRFGFEPLSPFGIVLSSREAGADLFSLPTDQLRDSIAEHRVAVLRRFASPAGAALPAFCARLGEILDWDFGSVNELRVESDAKNYLYTDHAVPFHWDGAFVGRVPHYIVFHCAAAPPAGSGGETLFCDTITLLARATPERRQVWSRVEVTYSTEKLAHYGGSFTSPLLARHPVSGEENLRFAEPVEDLNPVHLEIAGIPAETRFSFLEDLQARLYDPSVCYRHEWQADDVLIADNHALLHGRRAFDPTVSRHLRRVNVL